MQRFRGLKFKKKNVRITNIVPMTRSRRWLRLCTAKAQGERCPEQDDTGSGSEQTEVHDTRAHARQIRAAIGGSSRGGAYLL